jgi:hypothetical protein
MKKYIRILTQLIVVFAFVLASLSFLPQKFPAYAAASPGHFNCRWQADLGNKLYCGINDSQCNTSQGEQPDGTKCATYTSKDTCDNAPEFSCLTNIPQYQPTGASCANRKGECPSSIYSNCTDNSNWQTCNSGGSNYCFIPYYVPMGDVSPYNGGSCTSKSGSPAPSASIGSPSNCPVCKSGWGWSYTYKQCQNIDKPSQYENPTIVDCTSTTNTCYPGTGCNPTNTTSVNGLTPTCDNGNGIDTAIGCIPVTDMNKFISFILRWAIGIGGGIAFLLILWSGFVIMTSQGNPERLKAGQELLTSALAGLIMLIFSVFILRIIGVDILGLPGLK